MTTKKKQEKNIMGWEGDLVTKDNKTKGLPWQV